MEDNAPEDNFLKMLWLASLGAGSLAIRHLRSRYDALEEEHKNMIDALVREGARVDASANHSLLDAAGQVIGYVKKLADDQSSLHRKLSTALDRLEKSDARMAAIEDTLNDLVAAENPSDRERAASSPPTDRAVPAPGDPLTGAGNGVMKGEDATPGGKHRQAASSPVSANEAKGETTTKRARRSTKTNSPEKSAVGKTRGGTDAGANSKPQRKTSTGKKASADSSEKSSTRTT
ncbi:MAG: hypothetical protein CMK32_15550 [Porticoccaceae bacterium]|nr:hypothetical protein [Porticoccaceae bacterium]